MLKVFLVVVACQAPNYTYCKWMEAIEVPDPLTCQEERVPVSGVWKAEVRRQGFTDWEVFTRCELINPEQNGKKG